MICVDGTLMNTGERSAPVLLKADTHTTEQQSLGIVLHRGDWKIALYRPIMTNQLLLV